MQKNVSYLLLCAMVVFFLLPVGGSFGQEGEKPMATEKATLARTVQGQNAVQTLSGIQESISSLQAQINEQAAAYNAATMEEQRIEIANEITTLTTQLKTHRRNFESIATGIDLDTFEAKPKQSFNWQEEVQETFGPILEEIKGLTARPREVQKLRTDITYYEKRLSIVKNGLESVSKRLQLATDEKLRASLETVKKKWEEREKDLNQQLSVVRYQLEEKEKAQQSLLKSTQTALVGFFKSRGLSLILSLLVFIVVFLLMRLLYRFIYKSARLDKPENRPFFIRLGDVLYHILTFIAATGALLLVLYLFSDWVLLGVAMIFLIGLVWTARNALPMFWEQIKIFLNLSTVREAERVNYNGLAWKVESLNMYTTLKNPYLKGGMIRVPIRELIGLQSRPYHHDEPWFPCREGHLVILSDETVGTVYIQTPEQVVLDTLGGCRKTYPTLAFLELNPINLSVNNFGVFVTFGLDYRHQAEITKIIPETLNSYLESALAREEFGPEVLTMGTQFKAAGASSLDLLIYTTWPGKLASNYMALGRMMQRLIVDACNQYDWGIPLNQMTVHVESDLRARGFFEKPESPK